MEIPRKRQRGVEVSLGRRYVIAGDGIVALSIPPGTKWVPKGVLGPITERYGVLVLVGVGPPSVLILVCDPRVYSFECGSTDVLVSI